MNHPSIFELRHFAVTGALDEPHVSHVSGCGGCAARLQRLAQGELHARGVTFELSAPRASPGLSAAMPAFLAVAATMLVLALVRPVMTHGVPFSDTTFSSPEGVHGIPSVAVIERAPAWVDGGSGSGSE